MERVVVMEGDLKYTHTHTQIHNCRKGLRSVSVLRRVFEYLSHSRMRLTATKLFDSHSWLCLPVAIAGSIHLLETDRQTDSQTGRQ